MKKRLISILLALAALLTLIPGAGAFSDITDTASAREVAVLQMMGVVNGTSATAFSPNGTLTRAQFCKMAVTFWGKGGEEPVYRSRTIFPDVRSTHWARGYINLAVSITIGADEDGKGGTKLIRGMGDGTFRPDRPITYAESVTILLRLLGYSDTDAGMSWPQGYLDLAAKAGLSAGQNLSAGAALTRAQAAHLFYTALSATGKNGEPYYASLGTAETGVILMDADTTAADGASGAMQTSSGTFKTRYAAAPAELEGTRGTLVKDSEGRAIVFFPRGAQETVVIRKAESDKDGETVQAGWLTDQTGKRRKIKPACPVYTSEEKKTWADVWTDLRGGTAVTIFYTDAGEIDCLYLGGGSPADSEDVVVARNGSGDFSALTGSSAYTVYRDGMPASAGEICKYDVATYDAAARILSVSSAKLTGRYDDARPNPVSPSSITILGVSLPLTEQAGEELGKYQIGDTVTALLTADGRVAGIVPASEVREDNVGVLTASGDTMKVKLLSGYEISGRSARVEPSKQENALQVGELVRVTSAASAGSIYVDRLIATSAYASLDLRARRLGSTPLTGGCRFFDRAPLSAAVEIDAGELPGQTVDGSKIAYAHKTTGGSIDLLVFADVAGAAYTYGQVRIVPEKILTGKYYKKDDNGEYVECDPEDPDGKADYYTINTFSLVNSDMPNGSTSLKPNLQSSFTGAAYNEFLGLANTPDGKSIASASRLTGRTGVRRTDFISRDNRDYLTIDGQVVPVAKKVQCYSAAAGTWFKSLSEARAYSDNLTVYYDKTPGQGAQIRVVVAE